MACPKRFPGDVLPAADRLCTLGHRLQTAGVKALPCPRRRCSAIPPATPTFLVEPSEQQPDDVEQQREDDDRVLVGGHHGEGFELAQLQRLRVASEDLGRLGLAGNGQQANAYNLTFLVRI